MTGQLELIEHSAPTDLGAFHGDPKVKAFYLKRLEAHAAADELVQGLYWENGRGCAIGCVIHGDNPMKYATALNIPEELVRLQDHLFEALPFSVARGFPIRFLSVIEPGADLTRVVSGLMVWLLTDPDHGVARFSTTDRVRTAIDTVAALRARHAAGDDPTASEWTAVQDAVVETVDWGSYVAHHAAYVTHHDSASRAVSLAAAAVSSTSSTADERDYSATVTDKLVELLAATAS